MTLGAVATLQARQAAPDAAAFRGLQISLPVTDLARSVEFYRTALDLEPTGLPTTRNGQPFSRFFNVGGQELGIFQGPQEGPRPDAIRLTVYVANPGEYAAQLRARGVAVNVQVTGLDRQPRAFTVTDPDGYRFYFTAANGDVASIRFFLVRRRHPDYRFDDEDFNVADLLFERQS